MWPVGPYIGPVATLLVKDSQECYFKHMCCLSIGIFRLCFYGPSRFTTAEPEGARKKTAPRLTSIAIQSERIIQALSCVLQWRLALGQPFPWKQGGLPRHSPPLLHPQKEACKLPCAKMEANVGAALLLLSQGCPNASLHYSPQELALCFLSVQQWRLPFGQLFSRTQNMKAQGEGLPLR